MDKQKLFSVYEKLYSENFGKMDCISNCDCACETKKYSILFPHEEEFIKQHTGKEVCEPNICLGRLNVRVIGKTCFHSDNRGCLIYDNRPLDCRIYPFYIKFDENGLHLYIDRFCPLAVQMSQNKEKVEKIKKMIIELDRTIDDDGFWKTYSSISTKEWDDTLKPQKICDII